jgi:hypothetical protein
MPRSPKAARVQVEPLESREVPATLPAPVLPFTPNFAAVGLADEPVYLAVAQGPGGGLVRVFDFQTGAERFQLAPFGPGYGGGVRVATGDVTGDGTPDVVCVSGLGRVTTVKVFDGIDGGKLAAFRPFGDNDAGGASVALADFNADGRADVVAGRGVASTVKVFDGITIGGTLGTLGRFTAFGTGFSAGYTGGVRVATGDVTNDGVPDIVAVTASGRSVVAGFDGDTIGAASPFQPFSPYYATGADATGGGWITAGDVNGDGFADVATGNGSGAALVRIIDGETLPDGGDPTLVRSVALSPSTAATGARPRLVDLDADGSLELVIAQNTGGRPVVSIYDATTGARLTSFYAFAGDFLGGVDVG